jgi:3-dehydroquinate synthase
MPTRLADLDLPSFPSDALLATMGRDKKVLNARLRFILLNRIGDAFIAGDVPEEAVREVLAQDG